MEHGAVPDLSNLDRETRFSIELACSGAQITGTGGLSTV